VVRLATSQEAESSRVAGPIASTLRLLAGSLFVVASVGNALGFLPDAERLLADMLELTLFDWYRDLFDAVVMANPRLWVALLSAYELTAGLLMLHRGRAVRIGLGMGIVFMLGIVPLIGWYSLTNLVTVVPLVVLIFFSYPRSLLDVLRRR
jgi:hypothetical protein